MDKTNRDLEEVGKNMAPLFEFPGDLLGKILRSMIPRSDNTYQHEYEKLLGFMDILESRIMSSDFKKKAVYVQKKAEFDEKFKFLNEAQKDYYFDKWCFFTLLRASVEAVIEDPSVDLQNIMSDGSLDTILGEEIYLDCELYSDSYEQSVACELWFSNQILDIKTPGILKDIFELVTNLKFDPKLFLVNFRTSLEEKLVRLRFVQEIQNKYNLPDISRFSSAVLEHISEKENSNFNENLRVLFPSMQVESLEESVEETETERVPRPFTRAQNLEFEKVWKDEKIRAAINKSEFATDLLELPRTEFEKICRYLFDIQNNKKIANSPGNLILNERVNLLAILGVRGFDSENFRPGALLEKIFTRDNRILLKILEAIPPQMQPRLRPEIAKLFENFLKLETKLKPLGQLLYERLKIYVIGILEESLESIQNQIDDPNAKFPEISIKEKLIELTQKIETVQNLALGCAKFHTDFSRNCLPFINLLRKNDAANQKKIWLKSLNIRQRTFYLKPRTYLIGTISSLLIGTGIGLAVYYSKIAQDLFFKSNNILVKPFIAAVASVLVIAILLVVIGRGLFSVDTLKTENAVKITGKEIEIRKSELIEELSETFETAKKKASGNEGDLDYEELARGIDEEIGLKSVQTQIYDLSEGINLFSGPEEREIVLAQLEEITLKALDKDRSR